VITTGQSPRWYIKFFAGNMIQKTFINATLKGIGIKNAKWLHCGDVSKGARVKREKFLLKLTNLLIK
jgi:NAD(P)H dehydrogenase (quinone)